MSANDTLMGGKSVEALPLGRRAGQAAGEWRGGRIVAGPEEFLVREPKKKDGGLGDVKRYPSGDPIKGVYVDVEVNGLGTRRVYIDGSLKADQYRSRRRAVVDAVQQAERDGLEVGGELYLAWIREVETGAPSPAQDWQAAYKPPANAALFAGAAPFGGAPVATPAYGGAPVPQQAPPVQQYPTAAQPPFSGPTPAAAAFPAAPAPQVPPNEAAAALGHLSAEQLAALGVQPVSAAPF